MSNELNMLIREAVARAICTGRKENPDHRGDKPGNDHRWQDYGDAADAVVVELEAASAGEPGRGAISNLTEVLCAACNDEPGNAFFYTVAASDVVRIHARLQAAEQLTKDVIDILEGSAHYEHEGCGGEQRRSLATGLCAEVMIAADQAGPEWILTYPAP